MQQPPHPAPYLGFEQAPLDAGVRMEHKQVLRHANNHQAAAILATGTTPGSSAACGQSRLCAGYGHARSRTW